MSSNANARVPHTTDAAEDVECAGGTGGDDIGVHHSAERWARTVLAVRAAREDPRTIAEWGRFVGVSSGTLRAWCYMAGVSPRMSLCLARTLRAAILAPEARCEPGDLLDVRDPRTLKRLLRLAGLLDARVIASPNVIDTICERQQFVRKGPLLTIIRRLGRSTSGEAARRTPARTDLNRGRPA